MPACTVSAAPALVTVVTALFAMTKPIVRIRIIVIFAAVAPAIVFAVVAGWRWRRLCVLRWRLV